MHKKWNTYVYLESDTISGNLEAGITKFIVTRHPLQFTHHTEIQFLQHCLWKSIVTFTPNNSVLCDTLQNTAYMKSYIVFLSVHFSAFTVFPVWRFLLSAHTRHECQDFPSSLACVAGVLYKKLPLFSTSLPAGLLVWPSTWISIPALGNFCVENMQQHFFLACFGVQDVCIDNCLVE